MSSLLEKKIRLNFIYYFQKEQYYKFQFNNIEFLLKLDIGFVTNYLVIFINI